MNELQNQELVDLQLNIEEYQAFIIKDISGLNWAFRKLSALNSKVNEVKRLADAERQRIEAWEKGELRNYQDSINFFEHKVKEYHEYALAQDPKVKSIKTPYGVAKSTTTKATTEKVNDESLKEYLRNNDMSFLKVETKESVNWSDLKKTLHVVEVNGVQTVVDDNGEIVPGVAVKPEATTFKLEVN